MFQYEAERWVPQFILNDKTGFALAKAIEAALKMLNDTVLAGLRCTADYDYMPEWRLDELAWEINCLFDYAADIEIKRRWIKSAFPMYRLYGTPAAVYQYIGGYFDSADLEEWWEYHGDPYHFRLTVEGEWTPENEAWARKALRTAKNARSVIDGLRIGTQIHIAMTGDGKVLGRFHYPPTGAENWAGRWPQENVIGIIDRSGRTAIHIEDKGHSFPYPFTGTRPEINTVGIIDTAEAGLDSEAGGYVYEYPTTEEGRRTGTTPQENTIGMLDESGQAAFAADARAQPYPYPIAGTYPDSTTLFAKGEAEAGIRSEVLRTLYPWPATGTRPEINTEGVLDEAGAGVDADAEGLGFPYPQAGTRPEINTLGVPGENDIHAAQADDSYTPIPYKMCGQDEI